MNRKINTRDVLFWLDQSGRLIVSLIFLAAGIPKLINVADFAAIINAYAILPDIFVLPTAILLPIMEILLAIGLLFNRFKSKVGITVMLLFFIVLLSYSIQQGLDIDCGCFGPEDPEHRAFQGLRVALFRDVVMLLPLMYSFWYHRYRHATFKT